MIPYIDTHAHVYLGQFEKDIDRIIGKAQAASVYRIYMPNIDVSTVDAMINIEDLYPEECRSMIGLHPCSVKADFEKELKILENWLTKRNFVGIGETGTDLYWDSSFKEQQVESLSIQIGWARAYDLPVILHSRNSLDLTIQVIQKNHFPGMRGIFHCFTGSKEQAGQIISLGFLLGIGGVLTFKNSELGKLIEEISPDHIVLETDSPFLAPDPHRGKRNEPSFVPLIAAKLAEIYGIGVEQIAKITTDNAKKVFREA